MTTDLDFSETERALREALSDRARQVHPSSRLDAILREASAPERVEGRHRGLALVAVAAAAAVVAGAVWASRPDTDDATLPAGPPSATASAAPQPSGSSSPSGSDPGRPSGTAVALAVYRVGTNGGDEERPALVREFWEADLDPTGPASAEVRAAVGESLRRSELWREVTVEDAGVTSGRITIELSDSGPDAATAEAARLEVAALVWTAQAAVGRGDVPVRMTTSDGGRLLGHVSADTAFTRAATPPEALADLWVDEPSPGAALPAGRTVTVRGQAVAFEATVEWELRRGTTTLRDGFATADAGAPRRGTFTVDLGRLEAGTWTFRAFTTSAEDGQGVVAERLVTFTVR